MTLSPDHADAEFDWDHLRETHKIMYIVKRPAYEFCFAVPRPQANRTGKAWPLLQVRLKDQCQMPDLVFEISRMEDFYEGLSRLMGLCAPKWPSGRENFNGQVRFPATQGIG